MSFLIQISLNHGIFTDKLTICSPVGMATIRGMGKNSHRVTYRKQGNYLFRCEATDNDGLSGFSTMTVTVKDLKGKHTLPTK